VLLLGLRDIRSLFSGGVVRKILRLAEYTCKDTISALKVLLALALQGKLRGLVVMYRTEDGREQTVHTGLYRVRPDAALSASLRMSVAQMQANGEMD
jgi:hypothetical protein